MIIESVILFNQLPDLHSILFHWILNFTLFIDGYTQTWGKFHTNFQRTYLHRGVTQITYGSIIYCIMPFS